MALFVITKRNPYAKPGSFIECFDHGCQKAVMEQVGNRVRVCSHEGIILEQKMLRPFMMRVQKTGLDK